MDREILFRGQTRKRGEKVNMAGEPVDGNWVYGGIFPGDGNFSIIYSYDPVEKHVVYTDTVGQYTGLTDKNGKKIFEGDIIRFRYWCNGLMCWVGVVEYDYGAMYVVRGGSNQECESPFEVQLSGLGAERIEVIGSVHDNPELIGGEDDG